MKKAAIVLAFILAAIGVWLLFEGKSFRGEVQSHLEKDEAFIVISSPPVSSNRLFKAGTNLSDLAAKDLIESGTWLPPGNYFLESAIGERKLLFPIPLRKFPQAPDKNGSFIVTARNTSDSRPPRLIDSLTEYSFVPSGWFLLGDRLNPREPHYVWLTAYFIGTYEVTNGEFRAFLQAPDGYSNDSNWTAAGLKWKSQNKSHATALLSFRDRDFRRFGQDDQPVTWVNWYEANAFCQWLSSRLGRHEWLMTLPTEAEWEKAARGPDCFDYGLGMTIGDAEVDRYNWKKNPDSPTPVVGNKQTRLTYQPNRYGLYHVSGNVTEWTQSVNVAYNQLQPYRDDERNHDDTAGLRVSRGGSWYSASTAYLYIPYRDAFQPEHSTQEIGFRIVAKRLP